MVSLRRRHRIGSEADRATFRTLHTAALASPALRNGLAKSSAEKSVKHLRALLGSSAVALTDTVGLLAWDGRGQDHEHQVPDFVARVVANPSVAIIDARDLRCHTKGCDVRRGIVTPLVVEERLVGTLQVFGPNANPALLRATEQVGDWISGQLDLAELSANRTRLMEAEVRALRAQISPHFIYNSLSAIASFVRTDPDRARELLLEFADFTRYSFRTHGEFTTLAEELRSIERYLLLERARFGDRLSVRLQIAPEVLGVTVPFLCLQPLVENAVKHGLEGKSEGGSITIVARNADRIAIITIEDDGIGEEPDAVRRALAGDTDSVGLGNVDQRLRATFGDEFGLVVETAPGAGTKVTVRIPKFAPGVQA